MREKVKSRGVGFKPVARANSRTGRGSRGEASMGQSVSLGGPESVPVSEAGTGIEIAGMPEGSSVNRAAGKKRTARTRANRMTGRKTTVQKKRSVDEQEAPSAQSEPAVEQQKVDKPKMSNDVFSSNLLENMNMTFEYQEEGLDYIKWLLTLADTDDFYDVEPAVNKNSLVAPIDASSFVTYLLPVAEEESQVSQSPVSVEEESRPVNEVEVEVL